MQILFADDDPILREFAAVHLAEGSVEVKTAEDGVVALEMLKAERFDVLLVDLEMPRLDGFEVLSRIRADADLKDLPVMVITGREDVKAIDLAFERGATSFLTKPINWPLLAYQVKFLHRSALAEAALRSAAGGVHRGGEMLAAVEQLVDASVALLKVVSTSRDETVQTAADGYRRAIAAMVTTLRGD